MEILYDYSSAEHCKQLCRDIQERILSGDCRLIDLSETPDGGNQKPQIFAEQNGIWCTTQYVGLFEYQGNQLFIGSRFDKRNPEPFFLWYLVEHFLGESVLTFDDMGGAYQKNFFDELLAVRMAIQIHRAWKHGGLRAYRSFQRNDSQVRGVIDIPRHIRENLELHNGRIAYRTQSYSLDNDWNILFLRAGAVAARRYPDLMRRLKRRLPEYPSALQHLSRMVPEWEAPGMDQVLNRTARRITNPVYKSWEPARQAARDVLRRMGAAPGESSAPIVTGVFLDINLLWERLLEMRLFAGAKKPFTQQSRDVLGGHVNIRPDFYFPAHRIVLDAKNRPAWERTLSVTDGCWNRRLNPADRVDVRDNIYQVLSYMLTLECTEGGVIFPAHTRYAPVGEAAGPPPGQFFRIPVCIPQAADYPEFRNALNEEFRRLRTLAPVSRIVT